MAPTSSSHLAKRIVQAVQDRAPEALEATKSNPLGVSRVVARQATVTVTALPAGSDSSDSGSHLSGGAIAGIVIGSIAGFLLLWWIIRSCSNLGAPRQGIHEPAWYNDDYDAPRSRSRRRSRSHHSHNHPRTSREIRQVTPVVVEDRVRRPSKTYVYESGGGRRSRDYH